MSKNADKFTTTTRPLQIPSLCVNRGETLFSPASCAVLLNAQVAEIVRLKRSLQLCRRYNGNHEHECDL